MAEILLDPDIRIWVILPIVLITFFVGLIRHHVVLLLQSEKKTDREQVTDSQILIKSRLLRENGSHIPQEGFLARKHYLNNSQTGFFKTTKRKPRMQNPMGDPTMMMDMMKGNLTNILPMIVIGSWINWTFSGFVTTKVPFPLTLRFKPMLQRGVELTTLDASWVSSMSWYFLNVFGLRSMYALVLGADNSADQSRAMMQDPMMTGSMGMAPDSTKAFKSEWEALQIVNHQWALENAEESLLAMPARLPSPSTVKDKNV
ncbi:ER membrane protein complex subunit 3-like [Sycon ciliatum]|uniref:ER membrane protein complex subunit 3-like n=1 Tax=Sycon ciliatum TaxID=27933 RepID=UPI0020AAC115|eukprot:scpid93332/ scgid27376/ Transmembrane protein 111 &gt; Transmembrane protein 111